MPLDLDTMSSGGCYFSLDALLEPFGGAPELAPLRRLVARAEEETSEQEIARLEQLRAYVLENPEGALDAMTAPQRKALDRHTDCLLETKMFFHTTQADGDMVRALVRREPAMFRRLVHAMDTLPPTAKIIMLDHHNHLSKVGTDITRARRPSMGELILDTYPSEMFSIWMLYDHGWLLNPMSKEPFEQLASSPDRIENTMIEAGPKYVLPLHIGMAGEEHLDVKRTYSYFSWSETSTLTTQTGALFFLGEITPLQK